MKHSILYSIIFLSFTVTNLFALDAFVITNRYYAPKIGSYVETDILIPASTVKFVKNAQGKYQGYVEVTLIYKKNNEVVTFDKYLLNSFEIDDSNDVKLSMIDRKRFALPTGAYTLEATFKETNSNTERTVTETFILDEPTQSVSISDIMLADSYRKTDEENLFTKSGFHITPYVLNYFPENMNYLTFYAEIYNTELVIPGEQFLVNYSVNKYKTDDVAMNMKRFVKMNSDAVKVLFTEFDIEGLPSGNYEVVVDVRDKNNRLLAIKKCFFQRSNIISEISPTQFAHIQVENSFLADLGLKEMTYQLRTIKPIVNAHERKTIHSLSQGENLALMKQFYLNFWLQKNPNDPQQAWSAYQKKVEEVNRNFSTCIGKGYGFETDRGRVYLQYGRPNEIITRPWEPLNYPYEVWQYYTNEQTQQTNVKFVFINRDMGCDNFKIEHSDMLGEIYNNQWPQMLDRRNTRNANTDDYWDAKRAKPYDPSPGSHINTIIKE